MQKKTWMDCSNPPTSAVKFAALGCAALGGAGQLALLVLVLGWGLGLLEGAALPLPWPWAVNVGWLILFALQHSGMARAGFKRWWTRLVSPRLERAVYVGVSGLLTVALSLTWQPLPGEPLWQLPAGFVVVSLLGLLGVLVVAQAFDQLQFFGLRQVFQEEPAREELRIVGAYRWVRHPQMACLLVLLWGQPLMPTALLLLNGGLTLYVLAALPLEERDLERQFGTAYAEYRRRVPALLPWRGPAPEEIHPAEGRDEEIP